MAFENLNLSQNNPVNQPLNQILNPLLQNVFDNQILSTSSLCNINDDELMDSSLQNIYNELKDLIHTEKVTKQSTDLRKPCSSKSQYQCINGEKAKKKRRRSDNSGKWHWTEEEDRMLVKLVQENGTGSWNSLARKMNSGRKGKNLRERYNNHLKSGLKKEPWSEEEDMKLIEAHENLGNQWVEISKLLPGRCEADIKNRWNSSKRRCLTAIKRNNNIPKGSSVIEAHHHKSLLSQKSPISCESDIVAGPGDNLVNNEQDLANGLFTSPYKLPADNTDPAFAGGSNGPSSSNPDDLADDHDSLDPGSLMNFNYESDGDDVDLGFQELMDLLDNDDE